MKIINKILDKFKTVYCEDCKFQGVDRDNYFSHEYVCLKYPILLDVSETQDYVSKRNTRTIHSFHKCKSVRKNNIFGQSRCFKFSKQSP